MAQSIQLRYSCRYLDHAHPRQCVPRAQLQLQPSEGRRELLLRGAGCRQEQEGDS